MYRHAPIARRSLAILLSFALGTCPLWSTGSLAQPNPASAPGGSTSNKANAKQLVDATKDSVVLIIQSARNSGDPRLARESASAQPFWSALKQLNEASDRVERGFFMRDKTFTTAIGDALSSVVQTDVAFVNIGARDTQVKQAIGKTRSVIEALAGNYGELAQRLKKGDKLSAAEVRQLEALRAKQTELEAQLDTMKKQLLKEKEKNKKALQGIEKLKKEVAKSKQRTRGNTTGAFVGGIFAGHILSGMCWGWHWWWGPWWGAWGPVFIIDYHYIYVDAIDIIDVDIDWELMELDIALDDYDFALDDFDEAEGITDSMDEYVDDVADDEYGNGVGYDSADTWEADPADELSESESLAEEHLAEENLGSSELGERDIDPDTGGYGEAEDDYESAPLPEYEPPLDEPPMDTLPDAGMDDMGDFDAGGFDDFY